VATAEDNVAWLTQEAMDSLKDELAQLQGPTRDTIVERIEAARAEGDLSENAGYHAAREELAKLQFRVHQLQDLLQRAHVGTPPSTDGRAAEGTVVTVRFSGEDETETFLLGDRNLASLDSSVTHDVYSPSSPLGAAVQGAEAGETVTYKAPNGSTMSLEIVSVEAFSS
jgi:transcription elongation factor GreA